MDSVAISGIIKGLNDVQRTIASVSKLVQNTLYILSEFMSCYCFFLIGGNYGQESGR